MSPIKKMYVKELDKLRSQKIFSKPVVAVMLRRDILQNLKKQMNYSWLYYLIEANQAVKNTLYFFSLGDVNLREKKIKGYYWHRKRQKLVQQDFPLPDVLYVRSGIHHRYTKTYRDLFNALRQKNGHLITQTTFNKWRLYQVISQSPTLKKYLPDTRTVEKTEDIEKMLQKYKTIYLKPHVGRKGENVLRIRTMPDGSYQCSNFRNGQLVVRMVPDLQTLFLEINNFYQSRKFLVQQGIQLLQFENRLVDLRAEVQYDGNGKANIVGISARLGQPLSPITTHGNAYKFEDFFRNYLGYTKEQLEKLRSEVYVFLTNIYEYLQKNYGRYAEIGIDFAVDVNQQIWFIEANSRSTKVSLEKAYGKTALYQSAKNILNYAKYLSTLPKKRRKTLSPSVR